MTASDRTPLPRATTVAIVAALIARPWLRAAMPWAESVDGWVRQ